MHTRRTFIKAAGLVSTSYLVGPQIARASGLFRGSPNEKVLLGMVGTNSRGFSLTRHFAKLPNTEIAYICDVDGKVVDKTVAEVYKITGKKPQGIMDIRKLLEKRDVDAIVIATPDHWHAPAAIMGCQAGKHVYVEKPCSHNPHEGEMIVAAAKKYNRLVQMGSQRRSFPGVQQMVKELHDGVIGRVYYAKGWYTANRKSIGKGQQVPVPENLNFDLWQGPAPRRPYQDNLVPYNWHWFWHWGTGEALNNGTHELDVMRWGMGVDYPSKVTSSGGRFHYQDDWQTPDTQNILYNFANNTAMEWEGRSCNSYPMEGLGRGVVFYGDKGTVFYGSGDGYQVYNLDNKLVTDHKSEVAVDANNTVSPTERLDSLHFQNFIEGVRGINPLNCPIETGFKSTLLPQLGNIAYRTNHVLHINPANGHIINDPEALKLWSREYEKGWEPKV